MEMIRGRMSLKLDFNRIQDRLSNFERILLDLGTGDGRYARTLAHQYPDWLIIGVDSCRENLRRHSQAQLQNLLFVIASAQDLPHELNGLITHVTINFPWGSLLDGLLTGDPRLMRGLECISRPATAIDVRLNGGALAEAGTTLDAGTERIYNNLLQANWQVKPPVAMDARALKDFPSTWAKRLAFGRDPRAFSLSGQR